MKKAPNTPNPRGKPGPLWYLWYPQDTWFVLQETAPAVAGRHTPAFGVNTPVLPAGFAQARN